MATVVDQAQKHYKWVGILTAIAIGAMNHFVSLTPESVTAEVDTALSERIEAAETRMEKATATADKARDRLSSQIDTEVRHIREVFDLRLENLSKAVAGLGPLIVEGMKECKDGGQARDVRLDDQFKQVQDAITRLQMLEVDMKTLQEDVDGMYGDPRTYRGGRVSRTI